MLRSMTFMGNLVRNADGAAGGAAPAPAPAPAAAPAMAGAAALAKESAPAAAPAPAAPAPADKPWWDGLPENLKTTAAAKQWKDPAAAVESYVNLEKIMGADKAGRTVMLPKDDATPEELGQFYKTLGVPDAADKYEIKVPEGMAPEIIDEAKGWMHQANVPSKLAQQLVDAVAKSEAAKMEQWAKQSKADMNDLSVEWGSKFEDNAEVARRAYRAAGLTPEQSERIEMIVGTKTFMSMFHKFGMNMAEAAAPSPGQGGGQFVMNKAEAARKADMLRSSPDFQARYLSPNNLVRQQAISELEELTKIAAG